jgi:hypothetical protein
MSVNALVLKKFEINQASSADKIIHIVGRKSGFFAFLLTILGLDATTSLRCTRDSVEYKSSSLFGETSVTIPLNQVTGIVGGYKKPIEMLIVAGISFWTSVVLGLIARNGFIFFSAGVVIPLILIIQYLYGKTMNLGVQNGGDKVYGLEFKKGLIEGVAVDIQLVKDSINLLNNSVLQSNK